MSAPTPAPGDDRPREGYYPDPSIPGYVRYWNGAAWVPGTSRPAPADGEPLSPPPGVSPAPAPAGAATPAVEETGPHFFDEDPADAPGPAGAQGVRAEPASAWGADRGQQPGFGGDQDRRVSWGTPAPADPRVAHTPEPTARPSDERAAEAGQGQGQGQGRGPGQAEAGNTFVFRRPTAADGGAGTPGNPPGSGVPAPGGPPADEGTMMFRPVRPGWQSDPTGDPGRPGPAPVPPQGSPGGPDGPGFAAGKAAAGRASAAQGPAQGQAQGQGPAQGRTGPAGPAGPAQGLLGGPEATPHGRPQGQAAARAQTPGAAPAQAPGAAPAGSPSPAHAPAPALPQQGGAPQPVPNASAGPAAGPVPTPLTSGPGGGQSSWPQQVHQLAGAGAGAGAGAAVGAGEGQAVAPWKPPVEDPFQAAARRQAEARPAGLGRRLAARLVDTVVLAGATAGAAAPLGTRAADHIDEKIDAAKLSGHTVTVWLLDGTTATYLGIVLAVLLLFGVVYEALPTARWGRTLGKKLCGLQVRDIEAHEPPSFGRALGRWLVYSVPGLLVVGLVGVLWCLFDRPWHQCWHDKAAHTFVAG
ncbi:RDD family protein [Streptomyces spiralis]|uniref:RDD family protein n=1 Tax=Streptomyces spiralis TaxID=66376 RepID=UPI0033FABD17